MRGWAAPGARTLTTASRAHASVPSRVEGDLFDAPGVRETSRTRWTVAPVRQSLTINVSSSVWVTTYGPAAARMRSGTRRVSPVARSITPASRVHRPLMPSTVPRRLKVEQVHARAGLAGGEPEAAVERRRHAGGEVDAQEVRRGGAPAVDVRADVALEEAVVPEAATEWKRGAAA